MAAQGAFGTDFYDRSILRLKHRAYYRSGRPVIKIGPKCALGSHEIRPIHSAPSLGQGINPLKCFLGSRPHSTTSAELELGMSGVSMNGPPPQQNVAGPSRSKENPRFKAKRVYPSIPNQPSEAGAHFMFELAKIVLAKAGGNSSTSLFTQVCSLWFMSQKNTGLRKPQTLNIP